MNNWYLKMTTTITVTTLFHLNNHQANQTLKIQLNNELLPPEKHPRYLGVVLDRTLTYRQNLKNTAQKLIKRNWLIMC